MIKYKSGRELEQELLERVRTYMDDECLINELMCYFSSDETVEALLDIANSYDVPVSDLTDEEEAND